MPSVAEMKNFVDNDANIPDNPEGLDAPRSGPSLDLFSIRQTSEFTNVSYAPPKPIPICENGAPFFAWKSSENGYQVAQGNCHSWSCPCCGIKRAKHEYGRIVTGCRMLAEENDLYFLTLTCRGKELSLAESEAGYYEWTNRLLTALRIHCRRNDKSWHYVQVTERQKRGHPHSHVLTTFYPHDLETGSKETWKHIDGLLVKELIPCLRSEWLEKRCISAGLGEQYDISLVESVEGASRYVAKYMFKPTMFTTDWPKQWRRVRYSRSFPKLPERDSEAFVLLNDADWKKLASKALVVTPHDTASHKRCLECLHGHDVFVREPITMSQLDTGKETE